jgi:hypothetical protein
MRKILFSLMFLLTAMPAFTQDFFRAKYFEIGYEEKETKEIFWQNKEELQYIQKNFKNISCKAKRNLSKDLTDLYVKQSILREKSFNYISIRKQMSYIIW